MTKPNYIQLDDRTTVVCTHVTGWSLLTPRTTNTGQQVYELDLYLSSGEYTRTKFATSEERQDKVALLQERVNR